MNGIRNSTWRLTLPSNSRLEFQPALVICIEPSSATGFHGGSVPSLPLRLTSSASRSFPPSRTIAPDGGCLPSVGGFSQDALEMEFAAFATTAGKRAVSIDTGPFDIARETLEGDLVALGGRHAVNLRDLAVGQCLGG